MSDPLHLAFLGCGFITRVHSRQLRALGAGVVCSYASRDRARAERGGRAHRGVASFGRGTAALDDPALGHVPTIEHRLKTADDWRNDDALAGGPRLICPRFRDVRGYQAMYRDFARAIRTGQPPEKDVERTMDDQRLMDQLHATAGLAA